MSNQNPKGLPDDWKAAMDQALAQTIDFGSQTAIYYTSLVKEGVPAGDAATITSAYVQGCFWASRGGGSVD